MAVHERLIPGGTDPIPTRSEAGETFSIALVGPYPPPYGGVSVHIKRAHEQLQRMGVPCRVYSQPLPRKARPAGVIPVSLKFSWKIWLPEYGWRCSADIVHFHDGWYWAPAARAMLACGKKIVWTFHDQETGTVKWQDASWFERRVSRGMLTHPAVRWVAVSSEVRRQLVEIGVPASHISVIPAYIPPTADDNGSLPEYVRAFVAEHSPVLSTYGWKLTLDAKGTDVYGFDLCVEALRLLQGDYPRIGLAISLPQVAEVKYFEELKRRTAEYGVAGRVLFITEPLDEVHSLWHTSDVFVRATNTDGDAVSVREALSMNVPVVASDASLRPDGVVLFASRSVAGLDAALREVLTHRSAYVRSLESLTVADNFPVLLNLYREVSSSRRSS